MNSKFVLDTNWVLRYLLNDNEKMADEVESFLRKAKSGISTVYLTIEVIEELVYVLTRVYKYTNQEVSEQLLNFIRLSSVKIIEREIVESSLDLWGKQNVDWVDALLITREQIGGWKILSFDRDIQKLRKLVKK
jgi:predicted nucleic-acid-binding protein